jgi:translocation and assembly module TamB
VIADWQLSARIKDHQTTMKSTLNLPKGDLQTTLMANASLSGPQQGQLSLAIEPGIFQLPPNSPLPNLPFKGGNILASLTPDALTVKGFFTLDAHKKIDIDLRLPGFNLKHISDNTSTMTGAIKVNINSLEFLQALSKNIEQPQGELTMSLWLKGAMIKPMITGEISLKNASVTLPGAGLKLNPIQISLTSNNNHWEALGSLTSGGQTLNLKGDGRFYPHILGQLLLQADHFPLIKTAQYNISLSPKLILRLTPSTLDISGDVLIPSAQLKLQSFSDSINLSDDVVFVHNPTTPFPLDITTNVQLTMGEQVALDVKGLHGRLDGSLQISKKSTSTTTAGGELHILEGKYRAYGQDLAIEQGQLLFTGGPIDNPGLNIRATRKFKNTGSGFSPSNQPFAFNTSSIDSIGLGDKTTVGIDITGRIKSPKIKLFSIPSSLSQSDILSMLILGKPVSQANKAGGQLLLAAVSSMNLDSGTKGMQLMDQLQHTLGLDFDIQNNTTYNQKTNQAVDNTSLVVGKSLTKRIYISYNIGLLQTDSNVLTLKYLLNKYFSLQVNASDSASGLDLLYNHSKN